MSMQSAQTMKRGSGLVLVMTLLSVLGVLGITLMSHTYYAVQTTQDHMKNEQFVSVAESVLRYGISWYQQNHALVHEEKEPGSWRLRFGDLPLGKGRKGEATLMILPGSEQNNLQAQVFMGKTVVAVAKCRVSHVKDSNAIETSDWSFELS